MSHLARMREMKEILNSESTFRTTFHLARMREMKASLPGFPSLLNGFHPARMREMKDTNRGTRGEPGRFIPRVCGK